MKRVCYDCPRKCDCYTDSGLAILKPGEVSDCGALFFNTMEAENLLDVLIDAIREVDCDMLPNVAKRLIEAGYDADDVLEWLDVSADELDEYKEEYEDEEGCEKVCFDYSNRFYKDKITELTGVEFADVASSEDNCVYFFYCGKEDLEVLAGKADEICAMVEDLEGCAIAFGIDPNGDEVHPAALLLALVVDGCACDYEGCEEDEEDSFNDMLSFLPLIFTKSVKKLDANNPSQRTVELTKREVEEAIGVTIEGAENFFNATADCLIRFEAEKALPDGVFCRVSVFESVIGAFDKHKQPFIQFIFSEPFMEEFICCEGLERFRFGMDADWLFDEDDSCDNQ